jgi:hypothetical protein
MTARSMPRAACGFDVRSLAIALWSSLRELGRAHVVGRTSSRLAGEVHLMHLRGATSGWGNGHHAQRAGGLFGQGSLPAMPPRQARGARLHRASRSTETATQVRRRPVHRKRRVRRQVGEHPQDARARRRQRICDAFDVGRDRPLLHVGRIARPSSTSRPDPRNTPGSGRSSWQPSGSGRLGPGGLLRRNTPAHEGGIGEWSRAPGHGPGARRTHVAMPSPAPSAAPTRRRSVQVPQPAIWAGPALPPGIWHLASGIWRTTAAARPAAEGNPSCLPRRPTGTTSVKDPPAHHRPRRKALMKSAPFGVPRPVMVS